MNNKIINYTLYNCVPGMTAKLRNGSKVLIIKNRLGIFGGRFVEQTFEYQEGKLLNTYIENCWNEFMYEIRSEFGSFDIMVLYHSSTVGDLLKFRASDIVWERPGNSLKQANDIADMLGINADEDKISKLEKYIRENIFQRIK